MKGQRGAVALSLSTVAVLLLAGCVQTLPSAVPPTVTPTPTASSTAAAIPTYYANGTAADNLAYFNKVGKALFSSSQGAAASAQGELIVNWFVDHGFNKSNMEVTPDKTSIGLAAWNIDFSVRFGKTCILGQAGNVGFQSSVVPVLATGKCLIGLTRVINW
ncbi:MAG TPA: hypothetical protein VHZ98_15120 [Galbitalea sp.]|nr:hypothetical protein [Galbitalea sp.]